MLRNSYSVGDPLLQNAEPSCIPRLSPGVLKISPSLHPVNRVQTPLGGRVWRATLFTQGMELVAGKTHCCGVGGWRRGEEGCFQDPAAEGAEPVPPWLGLGSSCSSSHAMRENVAPPLEICLFFFFPFQTFLAMDMYMPWGGSFGSWQQECIFLSLRQIVY